MGEGSAKRAEQGRFLLLGEGCFFGSELFYCRGFASAEATRGLCDRPLDCFASPSKFVDGICYRETRRGRKENRTLCAK